MRLLLAATFVIKLIAVLLFLLGVCEVLIKIQQLSLNDYTVSDLSAFYFSASSIITGAGGVMIVDNSYIHFLSFAAIVNILTSVISSRLAYGQYSQLNRLEACATYEQNVTGLSCLSNYDNDSSIFSEPVFIRGHQTDSLVAPIILSESTIGIENENVKGRSAEYFTDASLVSEPLHRQLTNSSVNNSTSSNTTYIVSDFMNEVQCYGDSDYFLAAYYCEFYQIAKNQQKADNCYCVTDATVDDHRDCFEYQSFPFCGDLLEQMPILAWSTYIIANLCWTLSFVLACILCLISNRLHGEISLSVLFYFKEYSERVVPHKMAVAQFADSDVVMADVVKVADEEGEGEGGAEETRGAAAVQEGAEGEKGPSTGGRSLQNDPPPLNDDLVREFDALLPTGQTAVTPSTASTSTAAAAPHASRSALRSASVAPEGISSSSSSSSPTRPAAAPSLSSGLVTASPVPSASSAPFSSFLRFSSRVAPLDTELDIAPIAPIQAYELL